MNSGPTTVQPGFILALVGILVFAMAARTPLDSDLWWHLRAGQETWINGQPLLRDTFSFTRAGQAWTNHSWLAQVILYLVFRGAGYTGLSALVALLAAASMGLVFSQMEGPPIWRAFLIILPVLVAAPVWSPRPQMFSFLLLAITATLVHMDKWRRRSRLWVLPMLFVLWSNLHGGYVLGLLWLAGTAAGECLNHLLGYRGDEVLSWRRIGHLIIILAFCSLAVVINPNGTAMWSIPFRTVDVGAVSANIPEWASPDFHQVAQQPLLWLVFALLAAVGLSGRRLDGTDMVLVVGFGSMAFLARRNFGPFALAAGPVLARHAWPAVQAWVERIRQRDRTSEDAHHRSSRLPGLRLQSGPQMPVLARRATNTVLLIILGLAALVKLVVVTQPDFVVSAEKGLFPVQAVESLRRQQPPGRLFNEYDWGGYLTWTLPEYLVFIDGRTDLYDDEIIGQWIQVEQAQAGWQSVLDKWGIRLALLKTGSKIVQPLMDSGWQVYYQDATAVVLGR